MIEGFAREMSEENMLQAILFAHEHIRNIVDMIEELREKAGLGKKELPSAPLVNPLIEIFRIINERRRADPKLGTPNQVAVLFGGQPSAPAELETPLSEGYVGKCAP